MDIALIQLTIKNNEAEGCRKGIFHFFITQTVGDVKLMTRFQRLTVSFRTNRSQRLHLVTRKAPGDFVSNLSSNLKT